MTQAVKFDIPQSNLQIFNVDVNIRCSLPTNISAVGKLFKFSKCPFGKGLFRESTPTTYSIPLDPKHIISAADVG